MSSPRFNETINSFWSEVDQIKMCEKRQPSPDPSEDTSTDELASSLEPEISFFKEIGLIDEDLCKSDSSLDLISLGDVVTSLPLTNAQKKTINKRILSLRKKCHKKSSSRRPDVRNLFYQNLQEKSECQRLNASVKKVQCESVKESESGKGVQGEGCPAKPEERNKLKEHERSTKLIHWPHFNKAYKVNSISKAAEVNNKRTGIFENHFHDQGIEIISVKQLSTLSRAKGQRIEQILRIQQSLGHPAQSHRNYGSSRLEGQAITSDQLGVRIESGKQPGSYMVFLSNSNEIMTVEDVAVHKLLYSRLRALAILELTSVLDTLGLEYERIRFQRPARKKKRKSDGFLFGTPLKDLLNEDRKRFHWLEPIPFILKVVIEYIRMHGLFEDGVLRVPGSQSRVLQLRAELEKVYTLVTNEDKDVVITSVLSEFTINEIVGVLKLFIRELPDHLLPLTFGEIFLYVPKIDEITTQLQILNLLVLLTGIHQRSALMEVLFLLGEISCKSQNNRMDTHNIATVMAPNLFPNSMCSPPTSQKMKLKQDPRDIEHLNSLEVSKAVNSCVVTRMLIDYQNVLFHIPPYILDQLTANGERVSAIPK